MQGLRRMIEDRSRNRIIESLFHRDDDLLRSRIMKGLPQEGGRIATRDQCWDRLAIHYAEDEAQRHGAGQEGRTHSFLREQDC